MLPVHVQYIQTYYTYTDIYMSLLLSVCHKSYANNVWHSTYKHAEGVITSSLLITFIRALQVQEYRHQFIHFMLIDEDLTI